MRQERPCTLASTIRFPVMWWAILLILGLVWGAACTEDKPLQPTLTAPAAPDGSPSVWLDLSRQDTPHLIRAETLQLTFDSKAGRAVLGEGWRDGEDYYRLIIDEQGVLWAASVAAELRVTVLEPRDCTLTLEMQPLEARADAALSLPAQRVAVTWNNVALGECPFTKEEGEARKQFQMDVPASAQTAGVNKLTFLSLYAVSDEQLYGKGNDARNRAFGLTSLTLVEKGVASPSPGSQKPIEFSKGRVVQPARTQLLIPVRLPALGSYELAFSAGGDQAQGPPCRVALRCDSVAGPMEAEIMPWSKAGKIPGLFRCNLDAYRGSVIELLFETGAAGPDAAASWQDPCILGRGAPAPPDQEPPASRTLPRFDNVVIVVLDALRADALGCYGYCRDTSPTIDSLAKQGVRFERAYSGAPYTGSSTWCLFTSLYPFQHGAQTRLVAPAAPKFAGVMQQAGLVTGLVSGNPVISTETAYGDGFTEFMEAFEPLDQNPGGDPALVTNRADDFIRRHVDKRFFLYVHYRQPHGPYHAPDAYFQTFTADPTNRLIIEGNDWRNARAMDNRLLSREQSLELKVRYDENLRAVDAEVGRLVETIRTLNVTDKTLLIITADHGEAFGEHRNHYSHGVTVYDTVTHVPLIFSGNGLQALLGATYAAVVSTVDLLPTLCQLAGVALPASMSSEALAGESLITKAAGKTADAILAYAQGCWVKRGNLDLDIGHWVEAFWWPRYKLIRDQNEALVELFDLTLDPEEQCNLAKSFPVLTDYYRALATVWKTRQAARSNAKPIPHGLKTTTEQRDLIRALGYL